LEARTGVEPVQTALQARDDLASNPFVIFDGNYPGAMAFAVMP